MLVKYIENDYIITDLEKESWKEVEEPDFYIKMASNRVKTLIFPSEQGDPNNLESYNEEQQEAIKLATAIYAMWYFDTNYDFTSGSVSVNFGGASMSESKTYNGEMVLPNVFDILKQVNLIPTTETFIFNGGINDFDIDGEVSRKEFKKVQQDLEYETDRNIRQDREIQEIKERINDDLSYVGISPVVVDNVLRTINIDFNEFNKQNADVLTKEQVYNAIYASGIVYQENFNYRKDWIVQIVDGENNLEWFLALKDSNGINPLTHEDKDEYWKRLEAQEIDLNIIIEQLKPYINDLVIKYVPAEVEKQINKLPETDYVQEQIGQNFDFTGEEQFIAFNEANGIIGHENEYWEDLPDIPDMDYVNDLINANENTLLLKDKKNNFDYRIKQIECGLSFDYKNNSGQYENITTIGINIKEQEQKVPNKFLNGKQVYIRHISLENVSTNVVLINNVDKVVNSNCFATTGNYLGATESHWQLPVYRYNEKRFLTINKINNNDLYFNMGSWGETINYFYGTIEYTKIGD